MSSFTPLAPIESKIIVSSLAGFGLLYGLSPTLAVIITLVVLAASLSLTVARLLCIKGPTVIAKRCANPGTPFISVQLATYAEPPEVVIKTLDSLSLLDYPNYEVLVIDNNTEMSSLYEPVRQHCLKLGQRFRFFHFDHVTGAKAGALNLALDLCDCRTDTILILDADYCASPELLREGASYFSEPQIALVQFPQSYRNVSASCGLSWEYHHFFNVYMNAANRANTVLSTGTVSFLKRSALESIGGWPCRTLTEDAELGLRLQERGLKVIYVAQVHSRGLMPTDLKSLRSQRRRWVLGNAQSIRGVVSSESLSVQAKGMTLLQLTAWCNPLLPCGVTLGTGIFLDRVSPTPHSGTIVAVSVCATAVYLSGSFLFFLLAATRHGGTAMTGLRSFLVHLGLFAPGALSWGELLVKGGDKSFVRTNKFLSRSEAGGVVYAVSASAAAVLTACTLARNSPSIGFCFLVGALLLIGHATLLWTLGEVRARTLSLIELEKRREPAGRLLNLHQNFDHDTGRLPQGRDGHGLLITS